MDKFLDELVGELKNNRDRFVDLSFEDKPFQFAGELDRFNSDRLIISISSGFLEKHSHLISNIRNPNYLEAIISLPIFKDDDNLMLLIFNGDKITSDFILIDETDCLLNSEIDNWTYIKNEIITKYNDFKDTDTSLIADVSDIISNEKHDKTIRDISKDDKILRLREIKDIPSPSKKRVLASATADDILRLKEDSSVRGEISKHDTIYAEENTSVSFSPLLSDLFYYKRRQKVENLLYKNEKKIIDDIEIFTLDDLADIKAITDKNNNDSILISSDKNTSEKLIWYNHEVDDFNGNIFIELDNLSEMVLKEYLYHYLRSNSGIDDIMYFSKNKRYIRAEYLSHVKILLPDLETQKDIVNTINESREFFRDVELLKKQFNSNILDYKDIKKSLDELMGDTAFEDGSHIIKNMPRSRAHAYTGLIWPLAISYLYATKGSYEIVERLDNYLTLFEFIAAFNAVILISGLQDDVYSDNFTNIWNLKIDAYKKDMTFGNWIFICKNAGRVYRENNFPTTIDKKLIRKITSKKIFNILFDAKKIRNDKYHGSMTNKNEAKKILSKLDEYLEEIYDILDVYSDYKLIYTHNYDPKENSHRVILLNGPYEQPIYEKMFFETQLDLEKLYLYNPKNTRLLEIKDSLMKFHPLDKSEKKWALYIYNSLDKDEFYAQYKCFQSNEDYLEMEFYDFEDEILR